MTTGGSQDSTITSIDLNTLKWNVILSDSKDGGGKKKKGEEKGKKRMMSAGSTSGLTVASWNRYLGPEFPVWGETEQGKGGGEKRKGLPAFSPRLPTLSRYILRPIKEGEGGKGRKRIGVGPITRFDVLSTCQLGGGLGQDRGGGGKGNEKKITKFGGPRLVLRFMARLGKFWQPRSWKQKHGGGERKRGEEKKEKVDSARKPRPPPNARTPFPRH